MAEVPPSPWLAGLLLKCPQCGKGALYQSYLKIAPRCAECGADFSAADPGDGPAVFVILIVGALATPLLFILQFGVHAPGWVAISVTMAFVVVACLVLLARFKAILFALQWKHKARQVTNEDVR